MTIQSDFWLAIKANSLESLNPLLDDPANISVISKLPFLHTMFQFIGPEIAEKLLSFEPIREKIKESHDLALAFAMRGRKVDVFKTVLNLSPPETLSFVVNNDALYSAIMMNEIDFVNELLKIDVVRQNVTNGEFSVLNDRSLFAAAVYFGNMEIVQALLALEDVKANAGKVNNLALTTAINKEWDQIIDLLLKNEDVIENLNVNVLARVVIKKREDLIEKLLKYPQIAEGIIDENNPINSIFTTAVKLNDFSLIQKFVELPSVVDKIVEGNLFSEYVKYASIDTIKLLLSDNRIRSTASNNFNQALIEAAERGDPQITAELLAIAEISENANALANSALQIAVKMGHVAVVEQLLKIPSVLNDLEMAYFLLESAVNAGHADVVKMLLEHEVFKEDLSKDNNLLLLIAIEKGYPEIIKILLEDSSVWKELENTDINVLLYALNNNQIETLLLLLALEPVKQIVSQDSRFLTRVVELGNEWLFDELLKIPEVEYNIAQNNNAVLRASARSGSMHILETLLAYSDVSSNVAAENNEALRVAAYFNHNAFAERLLNFPQVRDNAAVNNNAALRLAAYYSNDELWESLLSIPQVRALAAKKPVSQSIEIQDIIVTTLDALQADVKYKSITYVGEFGNPKADEKTQIPRLFDSIKSLMDRASYTHKQKHCVKGNQLKEESQNKITRVVTNEFLFYTKTPLSIAEFEKLQEKILTYAKKHPENLHLVLSSFAVKTPDETMINSEGYEIVIPGKVMNVAAYVECGDDPKLNLTVKNTPSAIDPVYSETRAGKRLYLLNINAKNYDIRSYSVTVLGKTYPFTFDNIIASQTAGGEVFLNGVELCLDHAHGTTRTYLEEMIKNHILELFEGRDPAFLPPSFSHILSSNSIGLMKHNCIGTPIHADSQSSILKDSIKSENALDHNYPMPLAFGPTVTLIRTEPWEVEKIEGIDLLNYGVRGVTPEIREDKRKSLIMSQQTQSEQNGEDKSQKEPTKQVTVQEQSTSSSSKKR